MSKQVNAISDRLEVTLLRAGITERVAVLEVSPGNFAAVTRAQVPDTLKAEMELRTGGQVDMVSTERGTAIAVRGAGK